VRRKRLPGNRFVPILDTHALLNAAFKRGGSLADNFNPYLEWLGLAGDRASSYYDLLSLPRDATDSTHIAAAAERARTKVRSFRPGVNARAWSQLLDEIQAAKDCLCDPVRKADYDAHLASGQQPQHPSIDFRGSVATSGSKNSELYPPGAIERAPAEPIEPRLAEDALPPAAFSRAGAEPLSATDVEATQSGSLDPMMPVALPASVVPAPKSTAPTPTMTTLTNEATPGLALSSAPQAADVVATRHPSAPRNLFLYTVSAGVLLIAGIIVGATVTRHLSSEPGVSIAQRGPAGASPPSKPYSEIASKKPDEPAPRKPRPKIETKLPREFESVPEPIISAGPQPVITATESPSTEAVAPVPGAAALSTPTPTESVPPVTRQEVQALIKALDATKAALGEQNFKAADLQLSKAESLAKLPKHTAAVARLRELSGRVKQFREAIAAASSSLQAGETFKVGNSTQVAFVEAFPDKVILRVAGMNRTYPFNDMPAGLALAIADHRLPLGDPMSQVVKGAYLLVHKRGANEERDKARELWQQAAAAGADMSLLTPLLSENYAEFLKDVEQATAN